MSPSLTMAKGMRNAPKGKKGKGRKPRAGNAFSSSGPSCNMPPPGKKVYHFERTIAPAAVTALAVDGGRSYSYTLGSLPGATEFTQLFDLYRITSFEITFSANSIGNNQFFPVLHMLADYDTFVTPTTFDMVLQRPHKRVALTAAFPSFTFKFRPRVLAVVQTSSGTSSSALAPANQWMDCNDSTVVYGGLIGWIENFNTGTFVGLAVTTRVQVDFAMVR